MINTCYRPNQSAAHLQSFEKKVCLFVLASKCLAGSSSSLEKQAYQLQQKAGLLLQEKGLSTKQKSFVQNSLEKVEEIARDLFSKSHEFEKIRFLQTYEDEFDRIKCQSNNVLNSNGNPSLEKISDLLEIWDLFIENLEYVNREGDIFFKKLPQRERGPFLEAEEKRLRLWLLAEDQKNHLKNLVK